MTFVEKDGVLCASRLSSDPNVVAADLPSRRAPPPPMLPPEPVPVFNPAWLLVPAVIGGGIAAWALLRDDDNDRVFIPACICPACEPLSGVLKATLLLSGAALAASLVFGGGTRHGTLSDVVPKSWPCLCWSSRGRPG